MLLNIVSHSIHTGIAHRLHYPTISMSFLNDVGDIISTPSQPYICKSSFSVTKPLNVTNASGMYTFCMYCMYVYVYVLHTYVDTMLLSSLNVYCMYNGMVLLNS